MKLFTRRLKPANMKLFSKNILIIMLLFLVFFMGIFVFHSAFAQDILNANQDSLKTSQDTLKTDKYINATENHICFKCHGHKFYTYYNDWTEKNVIKRMNPFYIIDSAAFYEQNHCSFKCIDCHDADYAKFPHDGDLQMEEMSTCLDCHEDDEKTAKYHFEEIDKEYKLSVHYKKFGSSFSCWSCHNPHKYKVTARENEDISKVIIYDNEICLSCHSKVSSYMVLSDSAPKNMVAAHDWLPNQKLHFQHVRCLDCHVKVQNDSMVDHDILPKKEAVRRCVDCHSQNTFLMATLYKFRSKKSRGQFGFLNATILNNSYVIGANRNHFLNRASLIIFVFVIVILIVHGILRIIKK